MLSTPLISCSSGVATVLPTVSAEAPAYWALTVMEGGAISGYCATGSVKKATPPISVIRIDITAAKIGRSMKKWEIFIAAAFLLVRRAGLDLARLGLDLDAGTHAHQPVDDDVVVGLEAVADDPEAAFRRRAGGDDLEAHGAVGGHGVDDLPRLVR